MDRLQNANLDDISVIVFCPVDEADRQVKAGWRRLGTLDDAAGGPTRVILGWPRASLNHCEVRVVDELGKGACVPDAAHAPN